MIHPPGYYASIHFDPSSSTWTGNPEVIRLIETYGEMLENATGKQLLQEIQAVSSGFALVPQYRNEALVVLAHALADR